MPGWKSHNADLGVPNTQGPRAFLSFEEIPAVFPERNFTISGITKDSAGAALGGCTVSLFNVATNVLEQIQVSDAGGNYSFVVDKTYRWYAVAYKAGAPDVAGTTVNTLAGA
jgi:hypothetical protein